MKDGLRFQTNVFPTDKRPLTVYSDIGDEACENELSHPPNAEPRLPKTIDSNCYKELVNCISECVLNFLNGNIKLTVCNNRKLQKYKAAIRKVADRHVSISGKKKLIVQSGGFLLPLMSDVLQIITNLILRGK